MSSLLGAFDSCYGLVEKYETSQQNNMRDSFFNTISLHCPSYFGINTKLH